MPAVAVEEIGFGKRERKRFIEVEFRLNRSDPLWVPPLRLDRLKYLDPGRNPFFEHAEVAHFVASRKGKDVGRIAAVRNRLHEEVHEEKTGFFGFLETENDPEVLGALLEAAEGWLARRGLVAMRGPLSYDMNGVVGVLLGPFSAPPVILMAYNRSFLPPLLEDAGLAKAKDLYAWYVQADGTPPRIARIAERVRRREGVEIRFFRMKRLEEEIEVVKHIYNEAWEKNWGFVPLTDAEIDYLAEDLVHVVDPDVFTFAYVRGQPVGFAMLVKDLNQALIRVRNGRLFPFGLPRLLLAARRVDVLRIMTLGILPAWRNRGLETLLYMEAFEGARRKGYRGGEASWILEDNEPMNRAIQALRGTLYRRYRIYEKALA